MKSMRGSSGRSPQPPAQIFINVPAWPGRFDIETDCIAAVRAAAHTTMIGPTYARIDAALTDETPRRRDRARDGRDSVAELLRFIDIGHGDHVLDFLPFRG